MTSQIGQLQAQLAELQTGSVDPGQVITPAADVGRSSLRALFTYALLGAMLGLALGARRSWSSAPAPRTASTTPTTSSPRACRCSAASP